jgi:hypothetical protein
MVGGLAMKVLVCGGRSYSDMTTVDYELTCLDPDEIITGGANGADEMARRWAARNGVPCRIFEADWNQHGKAAGPIRNQQMLDEGIPDVVIAFPGGRGTADMLKRAKSGGFRVIEIAK